MPQEIERKFLIDLDLIDPLENGFDIKQGYIATTSRTVVRTRIMGNKAFLTIKGENKGISRLEFEYEIPLEDANNIISELCNGPIISKTRYIITHDRHDWEIDIFHGDNAGLVIAEVELSREDESIIMPAWVTQEVSDDPKYYNSSLLDKPFSTWAK
ncbi:MAG: CYTH domain-containing protein [Cellvibrionaceae bacterium]